jgi:DNA-directed RNA polymerase subunit RPC12/RpoP
MTQNHELSLIEGSIRPKSAFKNKNNNRNLVADISPETRKLIIQRQLKIGWQLRNVQDYTKLNRCFRCSKFNHSAQECTGEVTCPLCTGKHKLKECAAPENEYKCINCITHNKYNKNEKASENHTSLDKNCPCLQTAIKKNKHNTEY